VILFVKRLHPQFSEAISGVRIDPRETFFTLSNGQFPEVV
jgi:hypothetical protein